MDSGSPPSSNPPSTPIPPTPDRLPNGMASIVALAGRRSAGEPLNAHDIKDMISTLRSFLSSDNNRSGPTKTVLFEAVRSLVKRDSRKLSRGWDKTQLATVLLRWCLVALSLPSPDLQTDLTVVICADSRSSKELTHKLFLLDEDTNTRETFLIESPSPVQPARARISPPVESSIPATPASAASSQKSPNPSPATSESFLHELDQLNNNFELLAPIPVVHTPRVSPGKNFPQPDSVDPGAKAQGIPHGHREPAATPPVVETPAAGLRLTILSGHALPVPARPIHRDYP